MTAKDVVKKTDEAGLRLVRFLWCGNDGTVRAKSSSRRGLEGRLGAGIGLTVAMQAMNSLDQLQPVPGMGPVGEIRLVPDLDTFRVLPYAPHTGAVLTDHVQLGGDPAPVCQRSFLKRIEARLAERGLVLRASFENEFSLATKIDGAYVPIDSGLCFSTISTTIAQDYADDLAAALDAQSIPLEQYYAELGHGQQEISTGHAPAVQAADEQLLVRETIRGVAYRRGLVASLAPKPWPENAGNGGHVHFSLWEGDRNRFYDAARPDGLSDLARSFIAGVLAHLPGLCGLTAPSFNSYRRLQPSAWASATTAWGFDNKEAALRVASPFYRREEQSYNIEFKASDPSANPYLALGALIACGLDGVTRELDPGEPAEHDPVRMSPGELERAKVRPLPATMAAALDELEKDEFVTGSMGDMLARCYLAVRRSEQEAFAGRDAEFEIRQHFYRF